MNSALRALNRFGLGARVGESRTIDDPRAWLRSQLKGGPPVVAVPEDATPEAITAAVRSFRMLTQADRDQRQQARRRLIEIAAAESRAALTERVTSDRPFVERLVTFWSNHLCISLGAKVLVAPLAGRYEREAIRPHVLGRFENMVLASAKHPAMLVYLDNVQSIGPTSRGAQLAAGRRQRGLNENYARELLELHTLGVDGGYTQQDVQELAKILTGWTVGGLVGGRRSAIVDRRRTQGNRRRPRLGGRPKMDDGISPIDDGRSIGFVFQDALHEPGPKTVLGIRYGESGIEEGERVIRALCRHPSTARFVATKLVTHFVADEPPPQAVDRIARTFHDSEGDLRAVAAALIDLPDAWEERTRKFRTPQDWLIAVLRALNAPAANDGVLPVLRQLRQPLWGPQAPKGFGDKAQEWADPDAFLNRAELARTIARRLRSRHIDARSLLGVIDVPANDPLRAFALDTTIPGDERLALVLAGPAFQWR